MRAFNFAAGPATLPAEVLEQVRDELLDWQGSGTSVMEVSHRGKAFMAVAQEAETLLRELLQHEGRYVVIKGQDYKIFPDHDTAMQYSLDHYWPEPALIKKIVAKEPFASLGGAAL